MRRPAKHYEPCPAPNCTKLGDFCRGFCSHHYLEMRKACIENGSRMNGDHEFRAPEPLPRWEYQGREQELIDALEAQDRESQSKSTEETDHGTRRNEPDEI